jgi:cyclic pyranopterin monophosphate synthase
MLELYTDGGQNPLRGQGGWGAVIVNNGQMTTFYGAVAHTTNNRMEITAALEGLKKIPAGSEAVLYTDSQYLFGCMSLGWARKANLDLFEQLDKVTAERKVKWQWIDQNIPNEYQQEAHHLATSQTGEETAAAARQESSNMPAVKTEPKKPEPPAPALSHVDTAGKPKMVDVSAKPDTEREAVARCLVRMQPETYKLIMTGKIPKGDVLTVAQLAGIMGSKHTPYLIPLCHPLLINEARVEFKPDEASSAIEITATVRCTGKTGVEMEALTAASVAALTVYDMCKAVDRGMKIDNLRLIKKSGGKSGTIVLE